eukprot:TRINITY_DN451_c0_g1_i1.p2 TRINITY_DN451_c0_g1~~TRINITY_DN451_c0_g1_i1.p2  ORF type:complete len:184 (-),score=27.52 TRINITY_DN451_c0_g1_i1:1493-2044(-)
MAISFDGRSHGQRSKYLSCSATSKVRGFDGQRQSKDWVFLLCEVFGNDSAVNMQSNCLEFWVEVQAVEDGQKITVRHGHLEMDFRVFLTEPADMKAHWAMFRAGGSGGNAVTGKVCQRCDCPKAALQDVYTVRTLKATDTVQSLAMECGVTTKDLRMVNNFNPEDEKAHRPLQSQSTPELAKF